MTKEQLIDALNEIAAYSKDPESGHAEADALLIEYINDSAIADAYENVEKWYA